MKPIKTFICLFSLFFSGHFVAAQITYSSSDYLPINDTMLYSEKALGLSGFNFDTTNANMHWDYSGLTFDGQTTQSYFDPNNSGYKNTWCLLNGYLLNCNTNFQNLTNLAINDLDSLNLGQISLENRVTHEFISTGTLEKRMLGLTANIQGTPIPFAFEYENPDSVYQFPLQYNVTDSSESRLVIDLSPAPIIQSRNSVRTNTVEGWGSLTTPYGTFNDVLKMKTIIERKDTLFLDTITIPTNVTEIEYKWWDAAYGLPVLIASGNMIGSVTTIDRVSYLDSTQCVPVNAAFSYQPLVPELDSLTQTAAVDFTNLSFPTPFDSVHWDFGDGGTSTNFNPTHIYDSAAVYMVQLIVYNTCDSVFYSDTLNLPLTVTQCAAPTADFSYLPQNPTLDSMTQLVTVEFTNLTSPLPIDSVLWDFGDGGTSTGFNPTHVYDSSATFNVQLIVYKTCESTFYSDTIEIALTISDSSTSGNEEYKNTPQVHIYPNPVENKLYIRTDAGIPERVEIYDMQGKWVMQSEGNEINVSGLNKGIYYLMISHADKTTTNVKFYKY